MSNLKISQLPSTSATTADDYFVKNNSTETTTNKVKVKDTIGLTKGTGADSIKSASFLSSTPATSQGQGSVAIGNDSEANADYSTAYGNRAECFDNVRVNSTALGAFNRVAQYSTAVGESNNSLGANSTAVGSQNAASGGQDVCLGKSNQTQGTGSIAIGRNNVVTHQDAACIGEGLNSLYPNTTHTESSYVKNNLSFAQVSQQNQSAFTVDLSQATYFQITLNQNATLNFINHRQGGIYYIYILNTGTYNFTSVTTAVGNLFFSDGGRKNITHNSKDLWVINAMGNTQLVTQYQDFT